MINLLSRNSVFEKYADIAGHISGIQKVLYFEEIKMSLTEQEMQENADSYDALEFDTPGRSRYNLTLGIDETDLSLFTEKLSSSLKQLLQEFEISDIIILSHLKMNFFGNFTNKYKPLEHAYSELNTITNSSAYCEAFEITIESLSTMINIAFWLERCDPSAPEYIFFSDIEGKLTFFLCKHGKVHLSTSENALPEEVLVKTGFVAIEDCNDNFTPSGKIEGRVLNI